MCPAIRQAVRGGVSGALAWALLMPAASATQPGRCTLLDEVASLSTQQTESMLSTAPARVCTVEFTATGANGFAEVYDAPSTTSSNRENVAEPSSATALNHSFVDFGEQGHVTEFGLGVLVHNGRVRVRWGR